jgi:transcriptional regulator with XRE-family HTH domain
MTGQNLRAGRKLKGWNQEQAARKLGVSQPYLSLLERDNRRLTEKLARKAVTTYGLPPTSLPVRAAWDKARPANENELALDLAALGYPGLSYLKPRRKKNPTEVLLSALSMCNMDSRLTEALPWVLLKYPEVNWQQLVDAAKVKDLQNRLGFVTSLAGRLAERVGDNKKAAVLRQKESALGKSRLLSEDTLCHSSLTGVEKRWLQENRPEEAKYWRVLTDLSLQHLSYVA